METNDLFNYEHFVSHKNTRTHSQQQINRYCNMHRLPKFNKSELWLWWILNAFWKNLQSHKNITLYNRLGVKPEKIYDEYATLLRLLLRLMIQKIVSFPAGFCSCAFSFPPAFTFAAALPMATLTTTSGAIPPCKFLCWLPLRHLLPIIFIQPRTLSYPN